MPKPPGSAGDIALNLVIHCPKVRQILLQELLQGPRSGQRDGVALYLHQLLLAEIREGA